MSFGVRLERTGGVSGGVGAAVSTHLIFAEARQAPGCGSRSGVERAVTGAICKDFRHPGCEEATMRQPQELDRNLALDLVRVTEAAAMAAGRWVGRGDKEGGDGAAVDAMRRLINSLPM